MGGYGSTVGTLPSNGAFGYAPTQDLQADQSTHAAGGGSNAVQTTEILVSSKFALVPNSPLDQTTQVQAFFTAAAAQMGISVLLPGNYNVTNIVLKDVDHAGESIAVMFAHGATLTGSVTGPILGDNLPADMTAAQALLGRKLTIYGLNIVGNGTAGQTGIRLACRSFVNLDHVNVYGCDTNFDIIFHLYTNLVQCFSFQAITYDFRMRSGLGLWSGATASNSASNVSGFTECRSYALTGVLAQFYIQDSDGNYMRDCTTEGGNPVNAVIYDSNTNSATSTRTFTVENHHPENFPTNAHFLLSPLSGTVSIYQSWVGTGGIFIDNSNAGITSVIDVSIPAFPTLPGFKTVVGAGRWAFTLCGAYGSLVTENSAFWSGGLVGSHGSVRFNDGTAEAIIPGIGLGLSGGSPFLHGADVYLISDRTALNVPGVHLTGATEIAVEDNGPVAPAFLANSMVCPSLDITNLNLLFTEKFSNGAALYSWLPALPQNLIGYTVTRKHAAPADADLSTGDMAIWFDQTAGAAKLMVKAKNASGTVVTGSLALT